MHRPIEDRPFIIYMMRNAPAATQVTLIGVLVQPVALPPLTSPM